MVQVKDAEATDLMTIGEVAQRAGINTSAVRFYERKGLLAAPERRGGQRRYDDQVLRHLALISVGREAGLTLAEIATLLRGYAGGAGPSPAWRALALDKLEEIDALMRRARAMRTLLREGLACDCLRIEDHDAFFEACADWAVARTTAATPAP